MGAELLEKLPEILEEEKVFENFLASEEDLYGVMATADEEEVGRRILKAIESRLA